jgi:TIR domain-containing protein
MTQVFISYSRNDMEFVQRLAADLQRAGLDVWWDLSDIQGSDVWERRIEEGLNSSQYAIVVLTPASLESRWVRREYLSADNKGLKIIPLKLKASNELPLTFRDIQPIDAINRTYAETLSEVLRIVNGKAQTGSVMEGERSIQTADLAGTMKPKGLLEKIVSEIKAPDRLTIPTASAPIGILELSGLILPIVYFILAGLEALDLAGGDETSFVWGLSAILTGFYLIFKRQISPGWLTKFSLIIFLMAHSVVSYSESSGMDLTIIPEKVEGLMALIIAGLLFANLRSLRRPAPYSSITFAVFLLLVGAKILINLFGSYPSEIYTFIILSGIIASIVLWLDQ